MPKVILPALAVMASAGAALALSGPAAAVAAPSDATPAPTVVDVSSGVLGQLALPADLRDYTDLGSLFSRSPLIGPDGRALWSWQRQRTSDDARAFGLVRGALEPGAVQLSFSSVAKSTALRSQPFGSRPSVQPSSFVGAAAVDGSTWLVDHPSTPRPARDQLLEVSDQDRAVGRLRMPRGIPLTAAVPTARGLRLVGVETTRKGRRSSAWPVVIDGRRVTRQRYVRAVNSVAALPDGSLLVAGQSGGDLPTPVLRISAAGRVSRLADRREPDAAAYTGGAVATAAGVALVESSRGEPTSYPDSGPAILKDAVVLRDARGRVTGRRLVSDLGLPTETCGTRPSVRLDGPTDVGPDGLPMVWVACDGEVPTPYGPTRTTVARFLVGLDATLRPRWRWQASRGTESPECQTTTRRDNGGLIALGCDGSVREIAVPGAVPAARGVVRSARRDGSKGAVVRISCRGPHGTVCTGVARVTVGGDVVGSARYALPARPGAAAATLDRHIPTTRKVPSRPRVTLLS